MDRSKSRTGHVPRVKVVHSAALGTEPIALVQQTRGCGQIACLVEQLAEKRTGEARGVRMRAHTAADLERPAKAGLGTRDVELIPGGYAVITGPVDARERSHHLVVGLRPLEQPVRRVELGSVDRR